MNPGSHLLTFPLYLFLVLLLTGCPPEPDPDPCPDPTNPLCDDYNPCYPSDCSKVVEATVSSTALESNLLNDDTDRQVSVYLPEGYETDAPRSYPVVYLLHGFTGDHTTWYGGTNNDLYGPEDHKGMFMKKMLDTLIQEGFIEPLIVVCPDNYNSFEGSWYTNSAVTGNWEDFVVQEVVSYIDSHYRTLAVPESRGIAGHSMGGYGAMKLAMKHPDIFSLVYSMSGTLELALTFLDLSRDELIAATQVPTYSIWLDPYVRTLLSRAAAFAPNPALGPVKGELPLDENGTLIDSTWQKWLEHDLYSMLDEYSDNLKDLEGIRFDCGNDDISHIAGDNFSDGLTSHGIDHLFESYSGTHTDRIAERMATKMYPFFSENLAHE